MKEILERFFVLWLVGCGDKIIEEHIETCSRNATYISWRSQNELNEAIGTVLTQKVVSEVNETKFFTLMADETTDCSGMEQTSICLRYVRDGKLHERLLQLVEAPDLSGSGIATQLLTILEKVGINPNYMIGQCYDGAAAMSGQHNKVQKHIRDQYPKAIYTHCASHRLNLCIVKACNVREIQSAMCTMNDIASFFSNSSKRLSTLHSYISRKCPDSLHSRLKRHCTTKWVENQEAVIVFKEMYLAAVGALDELSESRDGEAAGKAMSHLKMITTPDFLICMEVLNAVLNITKPVARKLQGTQETILTALDAITSCKDVIEALRNNEEEFERLFRHAEDFYGESIPMPRVINRQANRANPPATSPLQFYRRAVFLPFVDPVLEQLNQRFSSDQVDCIKLQYLIPSVCVKNDIAFESLRNAVHLYASFLEGSIDIVEAEFLRWRAYWLRRSSTGNSLPNNALDALLYAKKMETYPSLEVLFQILATLPVTTATNERSFSALKYLKTYLRSTMKEIRLNGLALLYVHRDISLDLDQVIDEFSGKNRRLNFS